MPFSLDRNSSCAVRTFIMFDQHDVAQRTEVDCFRLGVHHMALSLMTVHLEA